MTVLESLVAVLNRRSPNPDAEGLLSICQLCGKSGFQAQSYPTGCFEKLSRSASTITRRLSRDKLDAEAIAKNLQTKTMVAFL